MKRDTPLSRSEERRLEFQRKIIDAAIHLFAEKGVNETPVTEIIREAGIAHKTFFNHFPSKHHLLIEIARQFSSISDAIFEAELASDCMPMEKLDRCLMQISEGIECLDEDDIKMFKHVLSGAQLGPEEGKVLQQDKLTHYVRQILKEAEYRGQLREELDTEIYVEQVCGLFVASMMIWASQIDYPLTARMQRTSTFIRHAVFK